MTVTELIACVADRAGISRTAVQDFLKVLGEETRRALVQRGSVPVFGLGKLKVSERAERRGRNPKTGESLVIPAQRLARFSPSSKLKAVLNACAD